MLRRTPLRPGKGFKRKAPVHAPTVQREDKPMAQLSPSMRRGSYAGGVSGQPVEKEAPVRSEAYRRLVAAMPCAMCGKPGPSQAAHANTGKGMALKTDDRTCFPLCADDHRAFDQGGMSRENRRVLEGLFGLRTRSAIQSCGLWPKNVPMWEENQ